MPNLFMIDLERTEISPEERLLLEHPNVGSVILFARNFIDCTQLKTLTESITAIRPDIFIAVDHEGGNIQRFRDGFTSLPEVYRYGQAFDSSPEEGIAQATHYGEIMAKELSKYGVDFSLAPVLDLHNEQSTIIGMHHRAFHSDPSIVTLLATAFITGMLKGGMPAIGKHFPGHGSVQADSHIDKTTLNKSWADLQREDIKPFSALIETGLLSAVMPAHITYPDVDPDNPAGFSHKWLQTILRDELRFDGLVLSDCLSMKGADIGDILTRAKHAAKAGCDMLILCHQNRATLRNILDDMMSFQQSEASMARIEAFKQKLPRFSLAKEEENGYSSTCRI